MEFRMFTPKEYWDWATEQKRIKDEDPLYVSPIERLFEPEDWNDCVDDYIFTPNNWNGGDILRRLLLKHIDKFGELDNIVIRYYINNDQSYVFILTPWSFYEISWYKSRGRTELIHENDEPITLRSYVELYNYLYNLWEADHGQEQAD